MLKLLVVSFIFLIKNERKASKHGQNLSLVYYAPISHTSQIINNVAENENNIEHVHITINDLASKSYNEKLKIAKKLQKLVKSSSI